MERRVLSIDSLHAAHPSRACRQSASYRARVLPARFRLFPGALFCALLLTFGDAFPPVRAQSTQATAATVTIDASRPTATFSPAEALGAGVDGHGKGTLRDMYTPENVRAMRSAGLSRLTYRLRTELGIEAWHFNPSGSWSDPAHAQGYWVSDSIAGAPITITHGYRLPRRGNSIDQADNTGSSRLDDGDTSSYWKSNPYLDRLLDPDDSAAHPQWVIADIGAVAPVNAIRIAWAEPFATEYRVQYWRGEVVNDIDESPPGRWVTFPRGDIRAGAGGDRTLFLADRAVPTRFVRLVLTASSHTAIAGSRDPRDSAGYAIRELWIGTRSGSGVADVLRHGASRQSQSVTYASSTDPWHRAADIDFDLEQPGFDRVFTSGLTNGFPMMIPVPVLFSTPEDGANELRFLARRGYPVERIELGEEPDGQYVTPEDYAALYLLWASALHRVSPGAPLGGPSFQGLESQVMMAWPEDSAGAPWMTRFLSSLRRRDRLADFTFLSFEWYPFDDVCAPTAPQLAAAPGRLADALQLLEDEGVPRALPKVIAEYGYSAFASRAEVDIEAALFDADLLGHFLTLGGDAAYLYGYEPTYLDREPRCNAWGNNALFLATSRRDIRQPVAAYHALRLLTREWLQPGMGRHSTYRATAPDSLLSAYAVRRPDGMWSVLLVNRDPARARTVRIRFAGDSLGARMATPHDEWSFSRAQYRWHSRGASGYPSPDRPPRHIRTRDDQVVLPPYSLVVVRASRVP